MQLKAVTQASVWLSVSRSGRTGEEMGAGWLFLHKKNPHEGGSRTRMGVRCEEGWRYFDRLACRRARRFMPDILFAPLGSGPLGRPAPGPNCESMDSTRAAMAGTAFFL